MLPVKKVKEEKILSGKYRHRYSDLTLIKFDNLKFKYFFEMANFVATKKTQLDWFNTQLDWLIKKIANSILIISNKTLWKD